MNSVYLNQEQFENIFKSHLKIETYSKPIESLFSVRNSRKIDYKPYYQRNYVWDVNKATYFVESILLGTEIPPLIFFNNGDNIEIIDGRQRFETIKRFMSDEIKLKHRGLSSLTNLENESFESLPTDIRDSFLDSTLRIIEFEIVNEPKLDPLLQDKVKKEIFGRYNSGITPLKKYEIDNAVYDEDDLTNIFKDKLKRSDELYQMVQELFFKGRGGVLLDRSGKVKIETLLPFIRKILVLHKVPITYYAQARKNEILERLYTQLTDSGDDKGLIADEFFEKVKLAWKVKGLLKSQGYHPNRFFYECLVWAFHVLENENIPLSKCDNEKVLNAIVQYYASNGDDFTEIDYAFYGPVVKRYGSMLSFVEKNVGVDLGLYKSATNESKNKVREIMLDDEEQEKHKQLDSLRLNKPEPSRNSIEDISRVMKRRKFLVRPSYQRSEVINLSKASSIIESILLGITLPAIFVYKRENGISEVIDGQQRILTILGYIGEEYLDENGDSVKSKNYRFSLRNPKILTELKGAKFNDLPEDAQDKILDFELFVVSIEEKLNPEFDPIDLFIRLNDKPYPIKDNSFEMWNSWADKEVITQIKEITNKSSAWFFIKTSERKNYRDRMENEELITTLAYFSYRKSFPQKKRYLDIHQKEYRINARVGDKKDISNMISDVSTSPEEKSKFQNCLKETISFVKKCKLILLKGNVEKDILPTYLCSNLDKIFNPTKRKSYRRTFQDFYILWVILSPVNYEMVKRYRSEIYDDISSIFSYLKEIPEIHSNGAGYSNFVSLVQRFHLKFSQDSRSVVLSEYGIKQKLEEQGNICPISGAKVFWGDEIEVDHTIPLGIGGRDVIENLQVVHKDSNRKKGVRTCE